MTAGAFHRTIVALALAIVIAAPAFAQDDKRNVADVECKAVMRLNDRERENTIVFLHGYLAGKKGELIIDIAKLSAATDKFIDHCLDNPKDKAVEVMAAYVQ
jgi:HdeA/HdeB family